MLLDNLFFKKYLNYIKLFDIVIKLELILKFLNSIFYLAWF